MGLSAVYMILQQFFFMGRLPWLEKVFGLDNLVKLHHKNGKWGLVFLLLHPIAIIEGYRLGSGLSFFSQFGSFLTNYDDILNAFIGLSLFVIVVGLSFTIVRSRLRYETWYGVHLLAYFAVFFSLGHQIKLGHDLLASKIFYSYWIALYSTVFGIHFIFRFARPIWLFKKHEFRVSRIEREAPHTVSVYISGKNMDSFKIKSGQFMIFRFLTKKFWWQAHPFSLSMVPNGKEIRITVKELGDFTRHVKDLKIGTKIIIDGPYGVFTNLFAVQNKVLMIAGGIGITPIRSLMEEMLEKGKDVTLLYGNRTENDIVFKKELEELSKKYGARITHIISHDESHAGEKGTIDKEKISRLVPDIASREVFLCGPALMMESVIKHLKELGTESQLIHYEKFVL